MTAVLALSIGSKVDHYGALAGVAAIIGIGVLAVLYAAQAREVKRLREWAGRAPERDADLQQRVVAEAQRRSAAPAPVPAQSAPRTQPATAAGAPAGTAPPAARLPGPATPAGVPAAVAAASAGGAVTAAGVPSPAPQPPAPVPGAPAGKPAGPVPAVGAPAAPAASPGAPAPGTPGTPAAKPPTPTPAPVVAAAVSGGAASKAATPVTATPTSTAGPAAPSAPGAKPTVTAPPPPAAAQPAPASPPASPPGGSQPTMVVPPPRPRAAAPARTTAREAAASLPPAGHARRNLAVVIAGGIAIAAIAVLLITQVFDGGDAGTAPQPNTVAAPGQTTPASPRPSGSLPPIDRAATTVSVLNGTAVQGLARGASTKLTTRGYTEGIVKTNTNQQVPATTVYYVRGSNRQARDVARILGLGAAVVKPMDPAVQALGGAAPVVVVVGLDQAQ